MMINGLIIVQTFTKLVDADLRAALTGTGIVLNARIVDPADRIMDIVRRLWALEMKLILVTYCETLAKQAEVYNRIHGTCS